MHGYQDVYLVVFVSHCGQHWQRCATTCAVIKGFFGEFLEILMIFYIWVLRAGIRYSFYFISYLHQDNSLPLCAFNRWILCIHLFVCVQCVVVLILTADNHSQLLYLLCSNVFQMIMKMTTNKKNGVELQIFTIPINIYNWKTKAINLCVNKIQL